MRNFEMFKHFINFLIVWFIGAFGTNFLYFENPGSLTHYLGVSLIVSFKYLSSFCFWLSGHPCWSCKEEASYSQETILQINCWCYFGSHSEEENWKGWSSRCCQRSSSPVSFNLYLSLAALINLPEKSELAVFFEYLGL